MLTFFDLKDYFSENNMQLILAADAEPFVHKTLKGKAIQQVPAGGVSVALEPVAKAAHGIFIARGRTEEDKLATDANGNIIIPGIDSYTLHPLFFSEEEVDSYYFGFANQTLWPLSHAAFEQPVFNPSWFDGYQRVNEQFARTIDQFATEGSFIWLNDYQLAMVPYYLRPKITSTIALFWHIPWPTWEIFRVLPQKKQLLESLLKTDYIAFHRKYQADNFIDTVNHELPVQMLAEKNTILYQGHATTVQSLPMGIDADILLSLAEPTGTDFAASFIRSLLNITPKELPLEEVFKSTKVLLGVDRLDYTKGLRHRLLAIELLFQKYPQFIGEISYIGFLASSRDRIPSYKALKKEVNDIAKRINKEFGRPDWQPIRLLPGIFSRSELVELYRRCSICLVTPLDDGMNLVSKEFIISASLSDNPGMLVLSQFAGSASDLVSSLIVNPYDIEKVAEAIKIGLEMPREERKKRITQMAATLEERNVYNWALNFVKEAKAAKEENSLIMPPT